MAEAVAEERADQLLFQHLLDLEVTGDVMHGSDVALLRPGQTAVQ